MKIQCDVCERAPAAVICCADEAALCVKCDVDVHAANKLASKHQRLLLQSLSNKLPSCDICQEKTAFIFCVEDRALVCKDCDDHVHATGLSADHQRFLATGIKVALPSDGGFVVKEEPPSKSRGQTTSTKSTANQQPSAFSPSSWAVDEFLNLSDFESTYEKKEQVELGDFEWGSDVVLFGGSEAAEVPQLPLPVPSFGGKPVAQFKKPRYDVSAEEDDFFTVPDLG